VNVKSGKLPAIQFYGGDWRKDMGVQSLSYHHRGIWFEILLLMHESERRGLLLLNGRAMSDDELSRVLGLDNQNTTKAITELLTSGVASRDPKTDALMSRRMVRDQRLREIRQKVGKLGGNPALLKKRDENLDKQKSTTGVKQVPTPSSSSSASAKNSPSLRSGGRAAPASPASNGAGRSAKGEHAAKVAGKRSTGAQASAHHGSRALGAAAQRNKDALSKKTTPIISATLSTRRKWLLAQVKEFWVRSNISSLREKARLDQSDIDRAPWDERADAAAIAMLEAAPGLSEADAIRCLEHRSISVELGYLSASLQVSKWLRDLPSFLAGPLNKYGDPLPKSGGRYKRNG
jgi:hypothetical protein